MIVNALEHVQISKTVQDSRSLDGDSGPDVTTYLCPMAWDFDLKQYYTILWKFKFA